ncbi:serine/threonine-protein kinase [Micromonospora eburnea]|uniref:serine/threonine-protein kinase n=1 Tax=Micromonospora eburnea TaxID=227316 RepID=UPI003645672D
MLTRGVVLSDRYLLSERIATGGMGAVWKCTDTLLGREVAVKVLLPSLVADPEFTTRFHAEARMMAALRHPGIVQVHDFGSATLADGSQVSYLVMEYVDGEPLVTWIRRAGRLDPASTMSVVAQAGHALHAAHLAGIVHRDVKPGNLMVKRDGTVVLVDFGIARASTMAGITAAHMVLGTASYMSPEQATGQRVAPATDVYALGAVAYFCLAGRPPFEGENPLQVAMRHAQDAPPPLPADTPPAVVELVHRALAKSPGDRYPSAVAMAEAAQDARDATLASIPVPPRPPWAVAGPAVPGPAALPTPAPGPTDPDHSGGTPSDAAAPAGSPAGPGRAEPADPPSARTGAQTPAGATPAAQPPVGPPPVGYGAQPPTGPPPVGSGAQPPAGPPPAGLGAQPPAGPPPVGLGAQPAAGPPPALPAWSVGVAHPGQPGTRPGGYGPEQDQHPGSGVPQTLEERASRPGRGRILALVGAAGVVLALAVTGAVIALRSPDDVPPDRPAALTGESATADPEQSEQPEQPELTASPGTEGSPEPTPSGSAGPVSRSPSAPPSRPSKPGDPTPSAGTSAPPTTAATGSPKPAGTTSAPQKPNPYTAAQACGSGYQVIDSATLTANGTRKGRVYLLYNSANGYNCVVTLKDYDVGRATSVSAYLEVQGSTRKADSGSFSYYAGPVRVAAAKKCVKWGGSTGGASYNSAFEHCG